MKVTAALTLFASLIVCLSLHLEEVESLPTVWIPDTDVPLATLMKKLEHEKDEAKRMDLIKEIRHILTQKKQLEDTFDFLEMEIAKKVQPSEKNSKVNFNCYRKLMKQFNEKCDFIASSPYVGSKVTLLYNTCKGLSDENIIKSVKESISEACKRTQQKQ